jgi:hypothetical protein
MELGLTWLADTFGQHNRPRYVWQIDPSGHALLTPTLMAQLGFSAVIIDRIPVWLKLEYRANQSLQWVWRGADTGVLDASIFTHLLDTMYCTYNIAGSTDAERAHNLYNSMMQRAAWYRPGVRQLLLPFGCDFSFQHLSDWDTFDGILAYYRANPAEFPLLGNASYSTISRFFSALHADNVTYPAQGKRDFHPYTFCNSGLEPAGSTCDQLPTGASRAGSPGPSPTTPSCHAASGLPILSPLALLLLQADRTTGARACTRASRS